MQLGFLGHTSTECWMLDFGLAVGGVLGQKGVQPFSRRS
jgi:hypothetical protein